MPSALPKIVVRAEQPRIDAWKEAAGAASISTWAGALLDAGAGIIPPAVAANGGQAADDTRTKPVVQSSGQPGRPKLSGRAAATACPRERHHRPGSFCKVCGLTP